MTTTKEAKTEKNDNVRAVKRALDILLAFTPGEAELSAAELLARVDLSRPTLYRLLYTLQEAGFLVSVGEPQKFRLGPSVAQMAHAWTSSLDLGRLAEPILKRIREKTRETVALFVPQGEMRLCVAEEQSLQPLNFKRGVGYTEKIVRGATGRAILAYMNVKSDELKQYLKGTELSQKKVEAALEATRKNGYATSHNELISGAVAIAVPFFDRQGSIAGSIGVFGPEVRITAQTTSSIVATLLAESATLSGMLGYSGGKPK